MTARRPRQVFGFLLTAGALTVSLVPLSAQALGLGEAELRSYLGQPLRVRVGVLADSTDETGCVVVRSNSPDFPLPRDVRADVLSTGGHLQIDLRTAQPVNDLTISLRVSIGCSNVVSRDYVMFLDPAPGIALPSSAEATSAPVAGPAAATASATPGASTATVSAEPSAAAAKPRPVHRRPSRPPAPPSAQAIAANAANAADSGPAAARAAPSRRHPPAPGAAAPAAPTAPAANDRLVLSRQTDEPALSMAEQVAKPDPNAPPTDIERLRQIQREQARLVAILTNHDPDEQPSDREIALQKQLADLSNNLGNLSRQVNEVSTRNRLLEATRVSRTLAWVLTGVTIVALAIALWLAWRYRELQRRMAETPWWEQSRLAAATGMSGQIDDDHEHGPASTEGVEVVEVMPNTVPRPSPTATDTGVATEANPTTSSTGTRANPDLTSSAGTRQSVPSLTQYRPPVVPLWPQGEPDSHEREHSPTHSYIPFGLVSVTGSMDEQIDAAAVPLKLDFELDLPAAPPSGAVQAPPPPAPAPAPPDNILPPLNLELRKPSAATASAPARAAAPPPAPIPDSAPLTGDSIVRTDDVLATIPLTSTQSETGEPTSVHFRLVQFASVLDQIDEMDRLREPAKAIALLRQFVLRDEAIPTLFWLLLFHFYRQINKKPVYEALGEHFSRRYRRTMIGWDEELGVRTAQLPLAELPGIESRIQGGWGAQAGVETIRSLLCDRDQSDAVVFNARLHRDLLAQIKVFPLKDSA